VGSAPPREPLSDAELASLLDELSRPPEPGAIPDRIDCLREAIARTPRGIVLRSMLLGELAPLLAADPRGERAANVEKAVWTMVEALDMGPLETAGPRSRAMRGLQMLQLGELYRTRIHGRRADNLERAIESFERASELLPRKTAPDLWAVSRAWLGRAYTVRLAGERAANLERAIACCGEALEVQSQTRKQDDWSETMVILAEAYLARVSGERADNCELAIDCLTQALDVRPRETRPVEWAAATSLLGLAHTMRLRGDRSENLVRSIEALEAALEVRTREAFPLEWAVTTENLGNAYAQRVAGDRESNLRHAALCYTGALQARPPDADPIGRAHVLDNLGNVYVERADDDPTSFDHAIRAYADALELRTREADPIGWARTTMKLGNAYRARNSGGRPDDLERAAALLRTALEVLSPELAPVDSRTAARSLAGAYVDLDRWPQAADAYRTAVRANELLYREAQLASGREIELGEAGGLARSAAYVLAKAGAVEEAVETLERGRARGLGDALARDRAQLELARQVAPDAYARYADAAERLHGVEASERVLVVTAGAEPPRRAERELRAQAERAASELAAAVEELRSVPGCERLLDAPAFAEIRAAASEARPLVYLVPAELGGLALILGPDLRHPVWLPELSAGETAARIGEYMAAQAEPPVWAAALDAMTAWLWDAFAAPVLEALGDVPGAVLVPCGWTALLPLHAAWREDRLAPTGRRYALDALTLTYAPSARALATSVVDAHPETLLAVADPRPSPAAPLRYAEPVARAASAWFAHALPLVGERARRRDVLDALANWQVHHFDCHGSADLDEPLRSGLVLAGGEVATLRDILDLRLAGGHVAVLSACETAVSGGRLPDEVVSLPTGLVQAGAGAIVASLWAVPEKSTAMLMYRFYERWRGAKLAPAEALVEAQQWLRDTTNDEKAQLFESIARAGGPGAETAAVLYEAIAFDDPAERAFGHPSHWAAFSYTGAVAP
jgi:tetratricopeptide (TPR) repeat protein